MLFPPAFCGALLLLLSSPLLLSAAPAPTGPARFLCPQMRFTRRREPHSIMDGVVVVVDAAATPRCGVGGRGSRGVARWKAAAGFDRRRQHPRRLPKRRKRPTAVAAGAALDERAAAAGRRMVGLLPVLQVGWGGEWGKYHHPSMVK